MRYFVMVCETGSLTSAAELLFVTQPAISKALRDLEQEWGIQLFTRHNNRLVITRKGQIAYDKTKEFLVQTSRFENEIKSIGINNTVLTLVMNSSTSLLLYPTMIRSFRKEHPDIDFQLLEVKEHADLELANNPDADILIMPSGRHRIDQDRFETVHLFDSEYTILVGEESPLKDLKAIDDTVVSDKQLIIDYYPKDIYEEGKFAPRRLVHFLNGRYIQTLSTQFSLNYQAVQENRAYTFLFKELAEKIPNTVSIPLDPPWTQSFDLYYPKIKASNALINEFVDFATRYDYEEV
ncbi:MAG: LysR family transcriptional regulator [Erysipelotrichaceae bacterium]|nr:LysR family transcriptional regulator [Erysipelotrichaceae bacterium]